MRRYEALKDLKNKFIPGHEYEAVVIKKNSKEKKIVPIVYHEGGAKVHDDYEIVTVTDNSILNALAEENMVEFMNIICQNQYFDDELESQQEWCEIKHKDKIIDMTSKWISNWIEDRVNDKETDQCIFDIRINGFRGDVYNDRDAKEIKEITDILDRNNVKWSVVDTVPGSWCLNHDCIETEEMECAIEYSGVYPVNWTDAKDVALLRYMIVMGHISINVMVKDENGKLRPNM